jgi:hypothetical protein
VAPIAAAVLPHPPLLVPALAGSAAPELDPLRAACREALMTVTAAADLTIVIGPGPVWAVPTPSALGSFHPYGADLEVALPALTDLDLSDAPTDLDNPSDALADLDAAGLPSPADLAELPLSLAIAAQLLTTLDPPPSTRLAAFTVPATLGPSAAATIGHALAAAGQRAASDDASQPSRARDGQAGGSPDRAWPTGRARPTDRAWPTGRVGLVVMGDLSACRTDRSPGGFRPEAAAFDASIAEAFRSAAPQRLLDVDPAQAATFLASARIPLQVLAGAFEQLDPPGGPHGRQGPPGPGGRHANAPSETGPEAAPRRTTPTGVTGEDGPDAAPRRTTPTEVPGGDGPDAVLGGAGSSGILDPAAPELVGRVLYEGAPYGVGYLVATLTAR